MKLGSNVNDIKKGFIQILFPQVCVCCGNEVTSQERWLCPFCLEKRFIDANPHNKMASGEFILPKGVLLQQALWRFDKGGHLQDLLHDLKYSRLTGVGYELGAAMGRRLDCHRGFNELMETYQDHVLLVPVPLHAWKMRKRGYNQAQEIARGMQEIHDIPVIEQGTVERIKNTKSQTGFSMAERVENIRGAFHVALNDRITDKLVLIVDDVFTTGATSFELSRELMANGAIAAGILTIAQA